MARRQWIERGALQIFYIIPNNMNHSSIECLFLNPFPNVGTQRGVMTRLGDESYKSIFRNFHEYPLRTYIFHSVYSNIQILKNETSREIIGITGADGKVADLLANKMNFTMDLQWPDHAFFGYVNNFAFLNINVFFTIFKLSIKSMILQLNTFYTFAILQSIIVLFT